MIRDLSKGVVKPLKSTTGVIYAIMSSKPNTNRKKASKLPTLKEFEKMIPTEE